MFRTKMGIVTPLHSFTLFSLLVHGPDLVYFSGLFSENFLAYSQSLRGTIVAVFPLPDPWFSSIEQPFIKSKSKSFKDVPTNGSAHEFL